MAKGSAGGRAVKSNSVSASERAGEHIRKLILSGKLEPGSTLYEEALSREIGVSRTPVREALQTLQAHGFVRIERYRGAIVTSLETKDVHNLFDLRMCLENHAISRAIRSERELDLGDIEKAIEAQEALIALRQKGDGDATEQALAALDIDRTFHFGVLRLHHNPRLETTLDRAWDQVARCSSQVLAKQPVQTDSLMEHRRLLTALAERDLAASVAASEQHLTSALHRVLLSDWGIRSDTNGS